MNPTVSSTLRFGLLGLIGLLHTGAVRAAVPGDSELVVQSIATTVRQIFEQGKDAVVQIECREPSGMVRGTGFYVDALGTLYTLASITSHAEEVFVVRNGRRIPATVLLNDSRSGIAVLRSEEQNAFLPLGNSNELRIASPVVVIGYPLDLDVSPGFGLISGFDKKFGGTYFSTTHIRANIPVQRGQGGAPLLDLEGRVVGIVSSSVDGGATCHVLPIEAAEKIRRDLARFGGPKHGWVGVKVEKTDAPAGGSHAIVCDLDPEAPAGLSGLQTGDIVVRIGDHRVKCPEDILDASFFLTAGEEAEIEVVREGNPLVLRAIPTEHPYTQPPTLHVGSPVGE